MFNLGPITLSWHGLTIAFGLVVGGVLARRVARERELDPDQVVNLIIVLALSGVVGAKAYYLIENNPASLLRPAEWLSGYGFSFYGGILLGVPAAALYLNRKRLDLRYLDALASGFPLGMAVGRIGDVINGEHYGPVSTLPWAVRNSNPNADVPSQLLAYHSGGLYEVMLALAMFAIIWPIRFRLQRRGTLLWSVVGLYAAGRFVMFFVRDDSTELFLSLSFTQWSSLVLLAVAGLGLVHALRNGPASPQVT